mmetsp:Transcript_25039/g.30795  ORF Transcript_25039/g.30795 Transcript_25039/m.30795 type:complete len:680 (+) Transcript_25039:123-2162(+)
MPNLTVHLVKIINLRDANPGVDVADPYVKFSLEQNNVGFFNDVSFGKMESTCKSNERNPVYNETFVFEEIPDLDNMELTVKVRDRGSDDHLGSCTISLDDLDLEPIPTPVRRVIDGHIFGTDTYVLLQLTYGEKAEDADATHLSHVGQAAYETLRSLHAEYHHQMWNVTSGRVVGSLHQTPLLAFPGPEPGSGGFEEGHDDWFPETLGDILGRTRVFADVLSLGPPDGRFLTAFQDALVIIAGNAEGKERPVIVRMMFGNIVGMPINCNAIRDQLTKHLPDAANIRLWVGAWRRGVSWNHAKIIAVDGKHLHTGGHNLWDDHYLKHLPVHDLSLELEGDVTHDGHLYANRQWDFIKSRQETFWGTFGSKLPDSMPQVAKVRVIVSEWPAGVATEHPPAYSIKTVAELADAELPEDSIPILTIGRYGCLQHLDRPSDDAILAMLNSSTTILRLALQDLGPVCFPGTKIPLPGCVWPDELLCALATAIWERGVDVEIIVSNPNAIPGGLSMTEANYGNGWDCVDVAAEIIKRIRRLYPDAEDGDLREKVVSNLRVAVIRNGGGRKWETGMNLGMHAKHFIVDDVCAYIGSQNLYVCDLAEWGVVIDDAGQTGKFMEEYWNPMWELSHVDGQDVDVDVVMDSLDIDRDGGDVNDLDDDTKEKMKEAERANSGVSASGLYEEE